MYGKLLLGVTDRKAAAEKGLEEAQKTGEAVAKAVCAELLAHARYAQKTDSRGRVGAASTHSPYGPCCAAQKLAL